MTTYRILKSEGKATLAIAKGFNWPAAILAPFWAAYKGFWPGAFVFAAVNVCFQFILRLYEGRETYFMIIVFFAFLIGWTYLIGKHANLLLTAYKTSKGYKIVGVLKANTEDTALDMVGGNSVESRSDDSLNGSSPNVEKL